MEGGAQVGGECRVDSVDLGQGITDAGTDRFPRTLGLVSKASGPTAESGGRGQVLEQGIALPA